MSGAMNFASFLNNAVSGLETGMDMREKYDIYKQRRRNRDDNNAVQDKIAEEAKLKEAMKKSPPPTLLARPSEPTPGVPSAPAPTHRWAQQPSAPAAPASAAQAASTMGVYDESMYKSDAPLASTAALRRGAGANPNMRWRFDDPSIRRVR